MTEKPNLQSNSIKDTFIFFVLTLGICYLVLWGPLVVFKIPVGSFVGSEHGPWWALGLMLLGGFMPSIIALVLTAIKEGGSGVKSMLRSAIRVKIGFRWYLTALILVIIGSVGQVTLNFILGHSFDFSLFLTQLPSFLPLILIGPISEELGWRGYAQEKLQKLWNPLLSSLVVGMVWGVWHLPLFLMIGTSQHELNMPFFGFFFGVTATSVLIGWLYNRTGNSIWTAIFFHWIYTYAAQVIATGATRSFFYNWLEYIPYILLAVIIASNWGQEWKTSGKFFLKGKLS